MTPRDLFAILYLLCLNLKPVGSCNDPDASDNLDSTVLYRLD